MAETNTNDLNSSDMKCNGYNDCSCIKRIMKALSYYHKVSANEPQKFIDFCEKYYSKQYLDDYIHFRTVHKNYINKDETENTTCAMMSSCSSTTRHYRDRSVKDNKNDELSHIYIDVFDSLHFFIYHLEECGLRVTVNDNILKDVENNNDYTNCEDKVIKFIQKEIEIRQEKCGLFKRLDNTKNSKFNIIQVKKDNYDVKTDEKNEITKENSAQTETEKTCTDDILDHIVSVGIKTNVVTDLKEYLVREEYDTDTMKNDMDIYNDTGKCNLLQATRYSLNCIEEIKSHMRMMNVGSAAFSTGFVYWYWTYYKDIDDEQNRQQTGLFDYDNDFGGYSVRQLFVTQKFDSLKSEILNCKFIGIKQFKENVVGKGDQYFRTEKCQNIRCRYSGDPLHFDIKNKSSLKREHLYSLILYCDFTDFCSDFSSTFRI
eukprot:358630_1